MFDWASFLRTGVLCDQQVPAAMRAHYFSTEDDAVAEILDAGLELVEVRGMDGPAPTLGQRNLARAPDDIVHQWGAIAYQLGGVRDYRSASTHLLLTVRKCGLRPTDAR